MAGPACNREVHPGRGSSAKARAGHHQWPAMFQGRRAGLQIRLARFDSLAGRQPIARRFGIAEPVTFSTARARVVSLTGSSPSQLAACVVSWRVFPLIEGSARFFLLSTPKHRSQAGLGPQIDRSHSILPDAPARCRNGSRDAPRLIRGGAGLRAHQKGEQALFHDAFSFALRGPVQQPVHPWSFSKGASLENHPLQGELPLLCRIDAPAVVPAPYLVNVLSYRDAVRLCWVLRRVRNMSLIWLAAEAGLTRQHVGDYLNRDDRSSRRNLPAEKVAAFERVCGNTAISQWLAAQSHLTVLEEMQASRRVA